MDKQKRLSKLLTEKRISYNPDGDFLEGNRLRGLYELIRHWFTSDFVIVEIGSCEGSSTELFALTCKLVYAIDPWDEVAKPNNATELQMSKQSEERCRERISVYDNVKILKGFAEKEVVNFEDKSLDAVYIDGAHDADSVAQDINLWLPKIKNNGIMCGHDWRYAPIRNVIIKKFGNADRTYKDGSWAVNLENEVF